MRHYAPYLLAVLVFLFAGTALFHDLLSPKFKNRQYGNPAREILVSECSCYLNEDDPVVVKLYAGNDSNSGKTWYSVTMEGPETDETQIFVSFGNPGVDSIGLCEKEIKLMCGKSCVRIPLDDLGKRVKVPLLYHGGREIREGETLPYKI